MKGGGWGTREERREETCSFKRACIFINLKLTYEENPPFLGIEVGLLKKGLMVNLEDPVGTCPSVNRSW